MFDDKYDQKLLLCVNEIFFLVFVLVCYAGCGGEQSRESYCERAEVTCVPEDYTSIGEALNNVMDGDVISVGGGSYYENIVIVKNVEIAGDGSAQTFIIGTDANEDVIRIIAGSVIKKVSVSNGKSCIFVDGAGNSEISDSLISNCSSDGIMSSTADGMNINIVRNEILGTADGIDLKGSVAGEIIGNHIHDNSDDGIDINNNVSVYASANVINNNGDDGIEIRLRDATDMVIFNNTIDHNIEDGVEIIDSDVDGCMASPALCNNKIYIQSNTLAMNGRFGLGLVSQSTEEPFLGRLAISAFRCMGNVVYSNGSGDISGDYSLYCVK